MKDDTWCKQKGLVCPKCESVKWLNNTIEKYYLCEECDFSIDYMVEDEYLNKFYYANPQI